MDFVYSYVWHNFEIWFQERDTPTEINKLAAKFDQIFPNDTIIYEVFRDRW